MRVLQLLKRKKKARIAPLLHYLSLTRYFFKSILLYKPQYFLEMSIMLLIWNSTTLERESNHSRFPFPIFWLFFMRDNQLEFLPQLLWLPMTTPSKQQFLRFSLVNWRSWTQYWHLSISVTNNMWCYNYLSKTVVRSSQAGQFLTNIYAIALFRYLFFPVCVCRPSGDKILKEDSQDFLVMSVYELLPYLFLQSSTS